MYLLELPLRGDSNKYPEISRTYVLLKNNKVTVNEKIPDLLIFVQTELMLLCILLL